MLKREVLPELVSSLEVRNTQINNGKTENLFADVEISRQLLKQSVFPRLINQVSHGIFIQDYTVFLTNLFFRKIDEISWKKNYLVSGDLSLPTQCAKPSTRVNVPVVYKCNAFTPRFLSDLETETQVFFKNSKKIESSSLKKNLFTSFFKDSCLSNIPFAKKYSNLESSIFSFLASPDYEASKDNLDETVCSNFPKDCVLDLKPGQMLTKISLCDKKIGYSSLLVRIQLNNGKYMCHCMSPKSI